MLEPRNISLCLRLALSLNSTLFISRIDIIVHLFMLDIVCVLTLVLNQESYWSTSTLSLEKSWGEVLWIHTDENMYSRWKQDRRGVETLMQTRSKLLDSTKIYLRKKFERGDRERIEIDKSIRASHYKLTLIRTSHY